MRKISKFFLCLIFLFQAINGSAGTCEGWPANYGGVMLQGFWWDSYSETTWAALTNNADELSQYFDLIWIPNAATNAGGKWNEMHNQAGYPNDMGYMPCMWLEYNTCFGTEAELRTMINTYKAKGTGIIEDVVINHKNGYEGWWYFYPEAKTVNGKTYTLTWDNTTWTGICKGDEANSNNASGIAGQLNSNDEDTGDNFDGCRDLNHVNTQVQENIKTYQDYLLNVMGFAGFRLDMVKGYSPYYTGIYNNATNPTFSVGEYWDSNKDNVKGWIDGTGKTSAAFDFPLKYTLNAAISGGNYSALSDKSFTADPAYARYSVTFADNHDTSRPAKDGSGNDINNGNCPLQYNWSAANAFLLAMPGTPCIWYPHYKADKVNIGAMILARKECGLTNQCTIRQQESVENNTGYILRTDGTRGTVIVYLGAAKEYSTPDGFTLVAQGDNYKFFKKVASASSTVYYTDTQNWETVYAYTWTGDNKQLGNWPGTRIYKNGEGYYTASPLGSAPENVIFNDGKGSNQGGEQSGTYAYTPNHVYNYTADAGIEYMTEAYAAASATSTTDTVYFENTSSWTNVYAFVWTGSMPKAAWPGEAMTAIGGNRYVYSFDSQYRNIIFSNGNSGNSIQTADLAVANHHVYNANGKTAELMFGEGTNALTFTNTAGSTTNYVRKSNGAYSCADLDLSDGAGFAAPFAFQAATADYSREMTYQWGTLVLPFGITYDTDNNYYKLYQLTATSASALTFTEYANNAIIPAGTPMLIKAIGARNGSGKYEVTLSASSASVSTGITPNAAVGGLTMNGTYSRLTNQTGRYFIAQDEFWLAEDPIDINPFRSWFEGNLPAGAPTHFTIEEEEAEATGIKATDTTHAAVKMLIDGQVYILRAGRIYDINGRLLQ